VSLGVPPGVWPGLIAALVAAFGLSALLTLCGPVDGSREARRAHDRPTPTSGGLGMIGAVALGLTAVQFARGAADPAVLAAFGVSALFGLLGALDDVFDFGARTKLAAQVLLALGFAGLVAHPTLVPLTEDVVLNLPALVSIAGTALWVVVAVNAVNFVDGSNGLVAGALAVVMGGLGLAAGGGAAALWLLGAAACLGFLPLNFPKARLFQGDAGALFVGALAATVAIVANRGGCGLLSLFAAPIALMPILADVFLTLIARARRKQRLFEAHREHLYQRWMAAHGVSHTALAWRFWLITAAFTVAAVVSGHGDPAIASATLVGAVLVSVLGWLWLDRSLRRSG
jgi:UDP-GlcNAc:undecaprenyl-phosphate GlcNAc-1-phosphate transferase